MSKQTDLINIPDAITVDGDNVGIGANSLSLGANNANSPQILFENSDGVTGDAALSTYDDASGTMLVMGSNFYINSSGSESRFNTSEESSAVMLNRNGDLNLLTGGTGATATTRLKIDSSGNVGIGTSSPVVNLHTTSGVARTSTAKTETAFFSTDDTDDFRFGLAISHKGGATGNDRYASLDSTTYQVSTDTFSESGSLVLQEHGGSVGIGTSSPRSDSVSTTLEVSDSTTARAIIKSTGTGGREYGWYSSTSGQFGLYDYTANTERMRIDSSGRVTMPYQPSFSVSKTGGAVGPGTFVVWNHVEHNIGSHYNSSNGAFTAPVSGVYAVSLNVMDESTSTHINKQLNIYRNSYIYQRVYGTNDAGGSHGRWTWSGNIYMSANDTLQILVNDMTIYGNQREYTNFSGFLIG
jgi:hypothetical protein